MTALPPLPIQEVINCTSSIISREGKGGMKAPDLEKNLMFVKLLRREIII